MSRTAPLKGIVALSLVFASYLLFLALWGWLFQPDLPDKPSPELLDPDTYHGALQSVSLPDTAPGIVREVDYEAGERAPWWPKGEAPALANLTAQGLLPPVRERVGEEPMVIRTLDGIGEYGGTWMRVGTQRGDVNTAFKFITSSGTLLRWSPKGYPLQPNVVRDWSTNEDATVWTFTLRKGARWSDGHPFTSEDFRFAYEVLYPFLLTPDGEVEMDQKLSWLMHRGRHGRVEIPDPFIVKVIFEDPHPYFGEILARPQFGDQLFVPAHYLRDFVPEFGEPVSSKPQLVQAVERSGYPDARAFLRALIGQDNPELPQMSAWIYSQHQNNPPISFVRNPYYWAVDEAGNQLPYLDEILFKIQQEQQIATTVASGGVTMQHRHIRFSDYTLLMNSRDRNSAAYEVLHWYPGERSTWTIFPNLNRMPNPTDPQSDKKPPILTDKRFRQALSLAIDRQRIIDSVYSGIGSPSQLEPGPESQFHNPELANAYVEFDRDRANALLDAIGLDQRDKDGYRTFPDGTSMIWYIDYTAFTGPGPITLIVDDWQKVGIRAISRERSRSLFYAERQNGWPDFMVWTGGGEFLPLVEPRSFAPTATDSFQFGLWGRWYLLDGYYKPVETSSTALVRAPPEDHPAYAVLDLLDRARASPDASESEAALREIFAINAEQVWSISVSTPPPILVIKDRELRNVPETAVQSFVLGSPANVAPEAFYFVTRTFSDGTPRTSVAKAKVLQDRILNISPNPSLSGAEVAPSSGQLIGSVLKWLSFFLAILLMLLAAVRHPYIGRRLTIMVPTLAVVSVIVFTIVQIPPGNLIETRIAEMEAQGSPSTVEALENLRELYWLEDPAWMRYLRWMGIRWFATFEDSDKGLLQGELGRSMESDQLVNSIVGDRLLLTVFISLGTILFTWVLAIPIGIYSAVRQYSIGDYTFTSLGILGMCIPNFLLALLLGYFGKSFLGIDMTGLFSPQFAAQPYWNMAKVIDLLKHIWVPVVVIGVSGTAGMIRVMRGNLLDELKRPYVTTALAKGVRPLKLLLKYPVRLALNPFISTIGGLFPALVSGGAVVAIVLSLPTVGPLLLGALLSEDMYMAGSLLMVLSLLGIVGTLVSDLLLLWLDPRIRMEGGSR
ncbi:MAG TPA: ABC transporter substrate-binding protein [Oceanipulchritudo sp.]|nr:ABC transporter substrate-binding protein [Oceanipulchritudo sp.]